MHVFNIITLIFFVALFVFNTNAGDESEEPDPWDKSTDKYLHRDANNDENIKVDVTEESESEVHTEKKEKLGSRISREDKKPKGQVDKETKQQFEDAVDEKDPAENIEPQSEKSNNEKIGRPRKPKLSGKKIKKFKKRHRMGSKKQYLQKKQFNYYGDFYPGSLWEYPYPYYHPQYGCGAPIGCSSKGEAPVEAKDDGDDEEPEIPLKLPKPPKTKKKKKQLVPSHYYGPPSAGWGGFQPGHTGGGWGAPYWYKKRGAICSKQLIPNHYYGPPSAGWGGFQPGHTGGGWGAPYWYKKRSYTYRQLIPYHYYGPPSAGWGGFRPGHTGGGWGAPYWYKRCILTHRQLVPEHYYGPPSAGWGGFQPGHTGGGWGAPYWYKSKVLTPSMKKGDKKFVVVGNDPHGMGYTGNEGWDSGYGEGYGHSWGQPNLYGWGPYAHYYGGPENIDYKAWHGPGSFGSKGWGAHGWLGDYGWMHGDGHEKGFGSGFAGWGNAGGDMMHLDEKIGEGDFEGGMGGFSHGSHGGFGHMGHNSVFQEIGYNLAMLRPKSKSKVPVTQNVEINFDNASMQQQKIDEKQEGAIRIETPNERNLPKNNELNLANSSKKTVKTRAKNEKPVTQ